MEIIRTRQRITEKVYALQFHVIGSVGRGYSFPCDTDGNVKPLNSCARQNLNMCQTGLIVLKGGEVERVTPGYIDSWENIWTSPALGVCEVCEREVQLIEFTNTCECDADYNLDGQRLAPREQWGEETGETASDILINPPE